MCTYTRGKKITCPARRTSENFKIFYPCIHTLDIPEVKNELCSKPRMYFRFTSCTNRLK